MIAVMLLKNVFIFEERRNLYDKLTFEACSGLGLTVGSEIVLSILLLGMRDAHGVDILTK